MSILFIISSAITALLTAVGTVSFYVLGFFVGLICKIINYFNRVVHGDVQQ